MADANLHQKPRAGKKETRRDDVPSIKLSLSSAFRQQYVRRK
jgi:hypothetical protein